MSASHPKQSFLWLPDAQYPANLSGLIAVVLEEEGTGTGSLQKGGQGNVGVWKNVGAAKR